MKNLDFLITNVSDFLRFNLYKQHAYEIDWKCLSFSLFGLSHKEFPMANCIFYLMSGFVYCLGEVGGHSLVARA